MNICIDESGSFVYTAAQDSWNCVVAYVYPEGSRRGLAELLQQLKRRVGAAQNAEIKLTSLRERDYIWFLENLGNLDGLLYVVATDASLNTPPLLREHQLEQVRKILAPVERMRYESGQLAVRELAYKISRLPLQLYVQMLAQVELVILIVHSAILYFVQRHPPTLSRFRWRIDQKNSERTEYEEAFLSVLPAFLQSQSLREPMICLEGADYSHFQRYYFPKGEEPTYLRDEYGIEVPDAEDRKLNIGKLVRENMQLVDSRAHTGVQIADLLASGVRRCLRGGFERNSAVARCLGAMMVQRIGRQPPIRLIGFGGEEGPVGGDVEGVVTVMDQYARNMVAR